MISMPLRITLPSMTRRRHGVLFSESFSTSSSLWSTPRAVRARRRCGGRVTDRLSRLLVVCSIVTMARVCLCFTSSVVRCVSARLGSASVTAPNEAPNHALQQTAPRSHAGCCQPSRRPAPILPHRQSLVPSVMRYRAINQLMSDVLGIWWILEAKAALEPSLRSMAMAEPARWAASVS